MVIRDTLASSADHTRISELPSETATRASGLQSSATEAIGDSSFLGSADLSSSDSGLYNDILRSVGLQIPPPAAMRTPVAEGVPSPTFPGSNLVETGPRPVPGQPAPVRSAPARSLQRGDDGGTVDGVPQIGAKIPVKPFYMGLVDVPGVGYANTVFSRNPSGEFDPTREKTEALLAQPLSDPQTSQPRSLTPAVVRLNINPIDMVLTYAKKVTASRVRANYVRRELNTVTGFTTEHHWDELDTVSLNCTTGNFWVNGGLHYPRGGSADTPLVANSHQAGFLSANRSKSLAYRKLQAVMAMFRNNGCGWLTSSTLLRSAEEAKFFGKDFNIIVNPGSAFMMYDNIIWYGHFESLSVTERGNNPNAFDFSIEFKVARTVDLNGVSGSDVLTGSEVSSTEAFFQEPTQSNHPTEIIAQNTTLDDVRANIARTAGIEADTRELLELARRQSAARLIERRDRGLNTLTDAEIDRISTEEAALGVVGAASRVGSGG